MSDPKKMQSPVYDENLNACIHEMKETQLCMEKNNYDRDQCVDPFYNYRDCQKFWHQIVVKRRQQRIEPELPPPHERQQIKDFLGDELPYVSLWHRLITWEFAFDLYSIYYRSTSVFDLLFNFHIWYGNVL